MSYPRVRNMQSRSGRDVPNQFIIWQGNDRIFQSYSTVIAVEKSDGSVILNEDYWDYSATTGKYRNEFLGEGIAETRRKIAEGIYKVAKL